MARKNPQYKWVGTADTKNIKTFVSTPASSVGKPIGDLGDVQIQSDVVIERCLFTFSTVRLLTSDLDAYAYIVAIQKVSSSGVPTEVLNPLDTDAFALANRDILAIGHIPVPPVIHNGSANATHIDRSVLVHTVDIKVRRKLKRANHALTLTLVADLSDVLSVTLLTRCLLKTSG